MRGAGAEELGAGLAEERHRGALDAVGDGDGDGECDQRGQEDAEVGVQAGPIAGADDDEADVLVGQVEGVGDRPEERAGVRARDRGCL
jgi:hypothetical protein